MYKSLKNELEYGLARQCASLLGGVLVEDKHHSRVKRSYDKLPVAERRKINNTAKKVVLFLQKHDPRLSQTKRITIQGDMQGRNGDVRDVVLETEQGEVGISVKQRDASLKHSPLSDQIDFGRMWYGKPCSSEYWRAVKPIFADLRKRQKSGEVWSDLEGKHAQVYLPLLRAFMDEITKHSVPGEMMHYVFGRHDHYKIIKENGSITVHSFNINGTLGWGKRFPIPDQVCAFYVKHKSQTTAIVALDRGWQIAFRLYSATSLVKPSLRFDIAVAGKPSELSVHHILYN